MCYFFCMTKKFKFLSSTLAAIYVAVATSLGAMSASSPVNIFSIMDVQDGPTWGLDRVDSSIDGKYTYLSSGLGVTVYVVDTGVDSAHPDFEGRVTDGFDAYGENLDQKDCQGHGTHVAGIIGGAKYGVAKKVTITPVRVLDCYGRGTTATLTAGIEWILKNHSGIYPGIVNMSLGGAKDYAVNEAVSRLVAAGFSVVSAAGNSNVDACTFSPASADGVIAVGSISEGDSKSSFSNWGNCVDIFAPGSKVISNVPYSYSTFSQKSGTSQSGPFVSGILATYFSGGVASTSAIAAIRLQELAEVGVVVGAKSTKNNVANVLTISDNSLSPEPVSVPLPIETMRRDYTLSSPKNFSIQYNRLYWSRSTYPNSHSKVSYRVQQYVESGWKTLVETKNLYYKLPIKSASPNSVYRVVAFTSHGESLPSVSLRNAGASAANLIAPIADSIGNPPTPTPTDSASGVSAVQRDGSGSSVVDVSWLTQDEASKYEVYIALYGSDAWSLVRATSNKTAMVLIKPNKATLIKIYSVGLSGAKTLLGQVAYLGKL
jgi:hypothetical protein